MYCLKMSYTGLIISEAAEVACVLLSIIKLACNVLFEFFFTSTHPKLYYYRLGM